MSADVDIDTNSAAVESNTASTKDLPQILVRYGVIPVVARCVVDQAESSFRRGQKLVIETTRGIESADFLQTLSAAELKDDVSAKLLRVATDGDLETHREIRSRAAAAFNDWVERITKWKLELELIDLEWTLDEQKVILYVLNSRGADTTKLAIQATAAGLGVIEVQPVDANGMVEAPPSGGGGCGSCSH